jgi:hypothetical protein
MCKKGFILHFIYPISLGKAPNSQYNKNEWTGNYCNLKIVSFFLVFLFSHHSSLDFLLLKRVFLFNAIPVLTQLDIYKKRMAGLCF